MPATETENKIAAGFKELTGIPCKVIPGSSCATYQMDLRRGEEDSPQPPAEHLKWYIDEIAKRAGLAQSVTVSATLDEDTYQPRVLVRFSVLEGEGKHLENMDKMVAAAELWSKGNEISMKELRSLQLTKQGVRPATSTAR